MSDAELDCRSLGVALQMDAPKTKNNRNRSKWLVQFDTGAVLLIPNALFGRARFTVRKE